MVAKAEVYMCQYCACLYLEEKDAVDCEKVHAIPEHLRVVDVREWEVDYSGDQRFPNKMLVEDTKYSGVLAEYHRVQVNSMEDFYERGPWDELGEWGSKQVNHKIGDAQPDDEDGTE
jgi:hypothetical protein